MKLKNRLIIAFCILIILPVAISMAAMWGMTKLQNKVFRETYGLENTDEQYTVLSNPLFIMDRYTKADYEELSIVASTSPDKFREMDYLNEINTKLSNKMSFIVVVDAGEIIYNGYEIVHGEDASFTLSLPEYGETDSAGALGYFTGKEDTSLLKQLDFEFEDKSEGSLFIITSSDSILPEIKNFIFDMFIVIVAILAITAGAMIMWIYRGTMAPLRKLQVATKNIKDGNLDFTIDYDEDDEMGDLCRNFEQMRQRLKESTEEKIQNEKDSRALISNIAHDLKTPITAVKGYSEGIIDGVADTPEKLERYIKTIYNKANEMDRLINELTIYSKIDTNRIPYNFNKINVAEYFNDCIEEIGLDLETKDIKLNYANYADENTLIIADPEQLMRVINNIVNNAVKYMDKRRGRINIRIKDVGDFIQVEIEDNGKGIAAKDLPRIFDRFYRTDSSRNSSTGGSGIGLSIVKKIVQDHGGQIWATSKENVGTTMCFVIRKYQEVPNDKHSYHRG